MRITYILEVNPYENSGIVKKVKDQVAYWTARGHQVQLLLSWPKPRTSKGLCIEGRQICSKYVNWLPDGFLKNFLNKIVSQRKLRSEVERFAPHVLYTRQNTWYPGITKHLKRYNSILELNSVDIIEVNFYSATKRFIYLLGRKKILRSVKGLVAVSPDILNHYIEFDTIEKVVVSNGINLERIEKIKEKPTYSTSLVFVGSKNTEWHGLNMIIELARLLPECNFNIVGYDGYGNDVPKNVKFHGWVEKSRLVEIYKANHFGIGSFGNHLVGKNIDSTLKVREYLAHGLPVILGHTDVDFQYETDFILKVTDDSNELINVSEIRKFLENYKETVVENNSLKVIDSLTKEEERLAFFRMISKEA